MTEQSPNDIFKASSFLQGHNAAYIEQLDPRSGLSGRPDPRREA